MTGKTPLACAVAVLCLLVAVPCPAQKTGEDIRETLHEEQVRADERQEKVQHLTREEKTLARNIAEVEARIRVVQERVEVQERRLEEIRGQERESRDNYRSLEEERQKTVQELKGLLKVLWPVHLESIQERFGQVDSWQQVDRRFTWLAEIYESTREKLNLVQAQTVELKSILENQRELEQEAESQLARINSSKDNLLRDKLSLRRKLGRVRNQRKSVEQELNEILATIETLNYKLRSLRTRDFNDHRHLLPWPVTGTLQVRYGPGSRGIGLSSADGAQVRSVFWGKVVHNDTLRGFGRVVIIYHGHNYYSLYAYLSDSFVRTGQEVEKDEPIGLAGYYPGTKGPGLYFELRFKQKPINPLRWLAKAK